ncbi:MAG: toll/interleukin-1 receptor domain-containing protein, partial [Huintestinicola sp.]
MADIFISHSSKDKEVADYLCRQLEENGFSCWIAPRDILPGSDWASSISKAIFDASMVLLIYSRNSAESDQV